MIVPRKKINLDAVRAALQRTCAKCGYKITPNKIIRVDWERQKCPACGEIFKALAFVGSALVVHAQNSSGELK